MASSVDFDCLLREAFIAYDLKNMEYCLSQGACPNLKLHGKLTLLHCSYNALTVRLLLRYGADIKTRDKRGRTPLLSALENKRHLDSIKELLLNGAEINAKDIKSASVLHYALSFDSDSDVIMELLKYGAQVNIKDMDGNTPLHYASRFKSKSIIVRKLLIYGADVNAMDEEKNTPLHVAVKCVYSMHCETWSIIGELIEFGANITTKGKNGSSLEIGRRLNRDYGYMLIKLSVFNSFSWDYKINELYRHVNSLNDVDLMSHLNKCVREMDKTKKLKINNLCLNDYIVKRNGIMKPLYLPTVSKKALIQEISYKYHIYKDNILPIITTCLIRASLLICLRKIQLFNKSGTKNVLILNYDCLCKIAEFLSNKELYSLLMAFEELDERLLPG